jgi:hypothetical protein
MTRLSTFTAHASTARANDRNTLEHDRDTARPEALMREFDLNLIDDDPLYAPGQGLLGKQNCTAPLPPLHPSSSIP